ncbi:MAG: hypothetical protein AAGG02_00450 [Cyanobacteria bacterium P01_H01_bin.15]
MKKLLLSVSLLLGCCGWPLVVIAETETLTASELEPANLVRTDWQTYVSPAGLYAALFPAEPTESTVRTASGGVSLTWQLSSVKTDKGTYAAAFTDLPAAVLEQQGVNQIFQEVQSQLLPELELGGIADSDREIGLQGYPGREFLGTVDEKLVGARFYLVGNRLYGLFGGAAAIAPLNYFLNSFQMQPVWSAHSPEDNSFTADFPAEPRMEVDTMSFGDGELEWTALKTRWNHHTNDLPEPMLVIGGQVFTATRVASTGQRADFYGVAYLDLSELELDPAQGDAIAQIAPPLLTAMSIEELVDQGRAVSIGDYTGRAYLGIRGNQVAAIQLYEVKDRLYALVALAKDLTNAEQFLSSFRPQPVSE